MKNYLRFAAVIFLMLGLLLTAFPASAGAIKTYVTGEIYPLRESYPPEFRSWISEQYVWHWRNELMEFQYVASDDRLLGYAKLNNNGDSHYTSDWVHLFSHVWAKWTIYAEPEYTTPLWECMDSGWFDAQWNLTAEGVCQGRGVNKGLVAKLTITITDWSLGYMEFQGEILEPGGE